MTLYYAPNVSWLFPELSFKNRLDAVVKMGFRAVEFGFPSHADLDALLAAKEKYGIDIVLFNQDVPVWDRRNRGYLVDPMRTDEFKQKLDDALGIATSLGVKKVMLPAGVELEGIDRMQQRQCMLENLLYAATLAEQAGILLTIEVLNPVDNPGYFLTSSREAVGIVQEVAHPHIRFQFDTYHLQMLEGDLEAKITLYADWIGHIQFADYPGRHEPGTGKIDFPSLLRRITAIGYPGAIGLEYIPQEIGAAALAWTPIDMR